MHFPDPLVRLQAYVRHSQLNEIQRLSKETGIPGSVLVRQLFDRFLGRLRPENEMEKSSL
jgi:hypothetical protein